MYSNVHCIGPWHRLLDLQEKIIQWFVPTDLLKLLKLNHIRGLKYGSVAQKNLTIAHVELSHFASITASMNAEQQFAFMVRLF